MVLLLQSINEAQLSCFTNLLSRRSAPPQLYLASRVGTFFASLNAISALSSFFSSSSVFSRGMRLFSENTISSNRAVAAGFSIPSDALHSHDSSFDTPSNGEYL